MRIGIVLPSVPAYSESFFRNKIKGLIENNFEVIIFANRLNRNSGKDYNLKVAPILNGNKLSVFFDSLFILLRSFIFHFSKSMRYYSLERRDGINYKQRIKNIIRNHHILSEPLDLLHFGFGTMVFTKENIAKAIGAKMAVSFRGFDIGVYPLKNPNCYLELWDKVDRIHVISDDIKRLVYQNGFRGNAEIVKITPAIDTSFFSNNQKYFYSKENRFVTIARLHWKKGLIYTLEALSELKKDGIPFHYTIIGDGKEKERLIFAIHQLDLKDHVSFTGKIGHERIKHELEKADLYLQYSIQEGFCNSVLEAQALGLLCVVSNAEGLSENIIDNETGWVVPKCNSIALAQKIKEVIELPKAEKKNIINNAKERVSKHFSIKQQQEQFMEFYK